MPLPTPHKTVSAASSLLFIFIFLFQQPSNRNYILPVQGVTIFDVEQLESQFDSRLPATFRKPNADSLWIRELGFSDILVNGAPSHIGNWEIYASSYWYETRWKGMECPVLPYGFATYADWAHTIPCVYGDPTKEPKIIHVSTFMLPHFLESTMGFMNKSWRFVLVSGGADRTIPNNSMDSRYKKGLRGFGWSDNDYWNRLLNSPLLIHWYAENIDRTDHWKFSPIPTGSEWQGDGPSDPYANGTEYMSIIVRPLLVMVADRVRDGHGQWQQRADVQTMCQNYTAFCIQPFGGVHQQEGISQKDFNAHVAGVPFIACAHGGGVDPSPKAWDAIRIGTIPIIQKLTVTQAYEHVPCAMVDNWEQFFHHPDPEAVLRAWLYVLAPYYEHGSYLRRKALDRLSTPYWLGLMHNDIANHSHVESLTTAEQRSEYAETMKAKSRDHVMSVTIDTANKMIAANPTMFSSSHQDQISDQLPAPPASPHSARFRNRLRRRLQQGANKGLL